MRQQFLVGNWKMHMGTKETAEFVAALLPQIGETPTFIGIAPPFTSIEVAAKSAEGSYLQVGAQNMSEYPHGAYTGEISSAMVKECGATFVLVGHSERRAIFHEDHATIHRKVKWAIKEELLPILCIGETREQRDKEMTREVLAEQLGRALDGFSGGDLGNLAVAYEPVWAIGTGKTATPNIAQETHHLIRTFVREKWGDAVADRLPLLYGGSVRPDNIKALMAEPDIDGALVGGASLKAEPFAQLIKEI